jgi:Domain of unknown function (DUF362)
MQCAYSRRKWLKGAMMAASGVYLAGPRFVRGAVAPASRVAVSRCKTYEPSELLPTMQKMFDQLGGLGQLVKGKTVAIKINLTGAPTYRVGHLPLEDTHYTHPHVIAAAVHLMGAAGATRIRVLESPWSTPDPIEEYILRANWEPNDILNAAPRVEFENTNYLGKGKTYSRLTVPHGGYMFPAFDLNHSYADCDVFVSMAKEGACHGGRYALNEELLRYDPMHHLRDRRRRRRRRADRRRQACSLRVRIQ